MWLQNCCCKKAGKNAGTQFLLANVGLSKATKKPMKQNKIQDLGLQGENKKKKLKKNSRIFMG
jgi:hypothetical protein